MGISDFFAFVQHGIYPQRLIEVEVDGRKIGGQGLEIGGDFTFNVTPIGVDRQLQAVVFHIVIFGGCYFRAQQTGGVAFGFRLGNGIDVGRVETERLGIGAERSKEGKQKHEIDSHCHLVISTLDTKILDSSCFKAE